MAANVRYRSTYYNTTGTSTLNRIDILDVEAVGGIVNFSSDRPMDSFEGLTQDLKPGIYPSSFKFGMYIRETPAVLTGTTMGINSDFITDIFTAAEGRFLVAHYIDNVLNFIGPIIYDQCSYEDFGEPYLLNITAVDGLNRWQTTDYVSEVGQIKYYSVTGTLFYYYDNTPLTYDGPNIGGAITLIEHTVTSYPGGGTYYTQLTTFAYREIFSINSPGTGWVAQGEGRWAKALTYSNEVITEVINISYHLTRDIDDTKMRTVSEFITRAMAETKMTGEYAGTMWDTSSEWFENDMGSYILDPLTQMRIHEEPFLGKSWADGMQEICRLLNLRIYYSKGRYHFEQISYRDGTTFKRFIYKADGTTGGAVETASLDLDFGALPIKPGSGGTFKILAPFRSVEARVALDSSNLLDGVNWKDAEYGQKYVGRVKQVAGDQKLFIRLHISATSTFDSATLLLFPQSFINLICLHKVTPVFSVRITNINTATTYYLTPTNNFNYFCTWESAFAEISAVPAFGFGGEDTRFSHTNYGHTKERVWSSLAETLPGSEGDMYDIFVSFRADPVFVDPAGAFFWNTLHPNKFWSVTSTSFAYLSFYSVTDGFNINTWTQVSGDYELVYMCENDVDNSIKVKTELQWADTGQYKKSIEIYNGTDWQRSSGWSLGGVGTPVAIGELLVYEIMSLRTLPKRLYSGSFLSSLPNAESRFLRGTFYYLPLSCSRDTDVDTFQGEFLEVSKTVPPAVDVIESPIGLPPLPPGFGGGLIDPPAITLYFETNEAITAGATLTDVDITNTLGVSVANGETVAIVNNTNGNTENLTLTAEILPATTNMTFESNLFVYSYPDASPILVQDGDVTITSGGSKYYYSNELYNGLTHTVPDTLLLTALVGLSVNNINKKVVIHRGGARMFAKEIPTSPSPQFFWYDSGTNQIEFHIELVNEELVIDIDLNR